ncbi:hypothetical protein, partial [Agrobacterium tumefaciens]|uniref:hypothetical protein n=1 Tax=Agrobacterium tumefaciens TaxID=358 RepID=UPI003BA2DCBC
RGRVGRCQVCKTQQISSQANSSAQPIQRAAQSGLFALRNMKTKGKRLVRPLKETNRLRQFAPEVYITASL